MEIFLSFVTHICVMTTQEMFTMIVKMNGMLIDDYLGTDWWAPEGGFQKLWRADEFSPVISVVYVYRKVEISIQLFFD